MFLWIFNDILRRVSFGTVFGMRLYNAVFKFKDARASDAPAGGPPKSWLSPNNFFFFTVQFSVCSNQKHDWFYYG